MELQTTNNNGLSLEAVKEHYQMFNQFKRDICKKDIDYGVIPGVKKPTLFQPGAQKLAKAFGLSTSITETSRTVDPQTGFVSYEYMVTVYRHGEQIAQGVGACNSFEDKYAYTAWQEVTQKPDENTCNELKALGLGKNTKKDNGQWGWFQRYKKDPINQIALQNTVMKMAQKRAYVSAVLVAVGGGEFFTQDIEDMPEIKETGAKIAAMQKFICTTLMEMVITRDELKRIWSELSILQTDADFVNAVTAKSKEIPQNG